MAPTDPTTWSFFTWWLWMLGLYYLGGFFLHWFRFRRLEAALDERKRGSVDAWNEALSGWPAVGYAKMLGKRKMESDWRGRPRKQDLK